jgi:hypothetical protein
MRRHLAVLLLSLSAAVPALACPYSIRDAGFIVRDLQPYRLVWVSRDATPTAQADGRALQDRVSAQVFDHANVRTEQLDIKREPNHPLLPKLRAASITAGQVALASPDDRVTQAPLSPSSLMEQALRDMFQQTVNSPQRQEIVKQIITAWCVVLIVEGQDKAQADAVAKTATAAAGKLVGFKPQMGDPIQTAPPIVRVAWNDPREHVLRWSVGLDDGDFRETRVAVLFGKGRRVGPVLPAAQATEDRLLQLFRLLGNNCTCTADPSWLLGPALPLNWGQGLQQQVREALGFDPNNPNVAATLSGVWKNFRAADSSLVPGETVPEPMTGYMEFNVEQQAMPPARDADPDAPGDGDAGAALEQRSWRAAVIAGAAIAAAALGGSAVLWLLHRGRA